MNNSAWKCDVCGYIHNGPDAPETCPVCGADSPHFSALILHRAVSLPEKTGAWQCSICDHVVKGPAPPEFCPICGAAAALFHPYARAEGTTTASAIKHRVILGAGIAGLTAAEEARRQAQDVQVTLISRELTLPYYRLNLTRFLAGEVPEEALLIQDQDWFTHQQIDYLVGDAVEIDRDRQQIHLRNGNCLAYDRLILANGAHPFVPPIQGASRDGVMVLRTLQDARKLIDSLRPGCRAVCVGGGLLGLESAWAMRQRGAEVTVLEGFGWLLPRQLPPPAAGLLQRHLQDRQLAIECAVKVKEFTGDEAVRGVLLEDGRELPADLVILATGVRPNSHLARQCALKVHQGVVVDDRMLTSDPKIFAAGDVTEHQGRVYGIWPASYAQGLVAGANAVGGSMEFPGIPMTNRIKVLDVDLFSIGQVQANDASTEWWEVAENGSYRGLACRDGQVIGAVLYGDMSLVGSLQEAVESGRRVPELGELQAAFPGLPRVPP